MVKNIFSLTIGFIPEKFHKEIIEVLEKTKPKEYKTKDIFWSSLYADNNINENIEISKQLDNYIKRLNWQIPEFWFCRLNGYGYLINPPNSLSQNWHIDYSKLYSSIFINLENCNSDNMTQYIPTSFVWNRILGWVTLNENEYLKKYPLEINITVPRKWEMIIMPPSILHRGITNNSKEHRTLFWISYQNIWESIIIEKKIQEFDKKSIYIHK